MSIVALGWVLGTIWISPDSPKLLILYTLPRPPNYPLLYLKDPLLRTVRAQLKGPLGGPGISQTPRLRLHRKFLAASSGQVLNSNHQNANPAANILNPKP